MAVFSTFPHDVLVKIFRLLDLKHLHDCLVVCASVPSSSSGHVFASHATPNGAEAETETGTAVSPLTVNCVATSKNINNANSSFTILHAINSVLYEKVTLVATYNIDENARWADECLECDSYNINGIVFKNMVSNKRKIYGMIRLDEICKLKGYESYIKHLSVSCIDFSSLFLFGKTHTVEGCLRHFQYLKGKLMELNPSAMFPENIHNHKNNTSHSNSSSFQSFNKTEWSQIDNQLEKPESSIDPRETPHITTGAPLHSYITTSTDNHQLITAHPCSPPCDTPTSTDTDTDTDTGTGTGTGTINNDTTAASATTKCYETRINQANNDHHIDTTDVMLELRNLLVSLTQLSSIEILCPCLLAVVKSVMITKRIVREHRNSVRPAVTMFLSNGLAGVNTGSSSNTSGVATPTQTPTPTPTPSASSASTSSAGTIL